MSTPLLVVACVVAALAGDAALDPDKRKAVLRRVRVRRRARQIKARPMVVPGPPMEAEALRAGIAACTRRYQASLEAGYMATANEEISKARKLQRRLVRIGGATS